MPIIGTIYWIRILAYLVRIVEMLYLDREKIISAVRVGSMEEWVKANYDLEAYYNVENAGDKFTNTMCITVAFSAVMLIVLSIPMVSNLIGMNDVKIDIIIGLCITTVLCAVIIPIIGYKLALLRAGKEWCEYRRLWFKAKKRYKDMKKRISDFAERY